MFIENRKVTLFSAALAAIGLVSVTGVLLAYPAPASPRAEAAPTSSASEDSQNAPQTSSNAAEIKRSLVADAPPGDVEKGLIKLAELQAEADLLEITLDGQRASILRSIQFLSGRVSRYAVQDRDGVKDWQQSLQKAGEQLTIDQESYRKNRVRLALLKYQIARESKTFGVSLDATAPVAELNRRLDRLEEKIDRLTGALSGKAGP